MCYVRKEFQSSRREKVKAWIRFSRSEWESFGSSLEMVCICRKHEWTTFLMCGSKLKSKYNKIPRFLVVGFMLVDRGQKLKGIFGFRGLNNMICVLELLS